MRITGTLQAFTPEQPLTTKDGRELKKRTIVIDAGYKSESGSNVSQRFAAQTFKEFSDEQLTAWKLSGKKFAFYIFFDAREYDGRYYQDVNLSNIEDINE